MYLVSSLNGLSVGPGNGSLAPNHDLYVTTAPHARTRSFVRTEVTSTTDVHSGPLYHGGASTGVIDTFNFFDVDNTVTSTSTGELPLNLGPAAFFAKFDNIHVWVSVQWIAGHGFWLFHDQGGDGPDAPTDDVVWRSSRAPTRWCTVPPRRGRPSADPDPPHQWTDAGIVSLRDRPAAVLGGRPAGDVADRRELQYGALPRQQRRSAVSQERDGAQRGRTHRTVTCGDTATVRIEAHDEVDETDMTLSLFRVQGISLTPVPLTALGGGEFEAAMADACDGAGAVDLLIVATDPIGNELRQELTPAFGCRPSTCGNGVTEAGEVCDDGNLVSNDGCDSLCASTENCGDGVRPAARRATTATPRAATAAAPPVRSRRRRPRRRPPR